MLSILPGGSTQFLYPPNVQNATPMKLVEVNLNGQPMGHPRAPRQAVSQSELKNVHFRSASMPESVYLRVQQAQHLLPQQPLPPQHPQSCLKPSKRPSNPSGLRRSVTNAGDLINKRPQVSYLNPAFSPQHHQQGVWGSSLDINHGLAARSRTNIATLGLSQDILGQPVQRSQVRRNITRATSFYHPQKASLYGLTALAQTQARPGLRPVAKDVSQPLHVDCSIEYDLGAQPKIPKDSAPLLIIHPAYDPKLKKSDNRFQPYPSQTSTPTHGIGQGAGARSQGPMYENLFDKTPQRYECARYPKTLTQSAPQRVSRHSSFLVTTSSNLEARNLRLSHAKSSNNLNAQRKAPKRQDFQKEMEQFQLSLPDISMDDEDEEDEEVARITMRQKQKAATTTKKQETKPSTRPVRRGTSMVCNLQPLASNFQRQPKARVNLGPKLEAIRKLSADSQDSGALSMSSSFHVPKARFQPHPQKPSPNYSFEFGEINDDSNDLAFESMGSSRISGKTPNRSINVHPTRQLTQVGGTFCDSGLGTPSSLIDDPELVKSSSSGISTGSSSNSVGQSLSRWKSSMSGIVQGFLCCSGRPQGLQESPGSMTGPQRYRVTSNEARRRSELVVWQNTAPSGPSGSGGSSTSGVSSIRITPPSSGPSKPPRSSTRDWHQTPELIRNREDEWKRLVDSSSKHGRQGPSGHLVTSSTGSSLMATPLEGVPSDVLSTRSASSASTSSSVQDCQTQPHPAPSGFGHYPRKAGYLPRLPPVDQERFYPVPKSGYFLGTSGTAIHI